MKTFSHLIKMEANKENLIIHTKIANVSATDVFYRHVGMLQNYKVL